MGSFQGLLVFSAFMTISSAQNTEIMDIMMPNVQSDKRESYLCRSVPVISTNEKYIIKFVPRAKKHIVHHMILYGCMAPAISEGIWNCGGMHTNSVISRYPKSTVCAGEKFVILYAWAMDANELSLPTGVGFRVSGQSRIKYLVLQMHYLESLEKPDNSGLTIHMINEPLPKIAGVLFLGTLGKIRAHTKEKFECACVINEDIKMHPFAFRTHTHKLGKVVSGYVVRNKEWDLIGKKNPQEPQMFYPVANDSLVIQRGDIVASRCTMENLLDKDVYIGASSEEEMCNYYVMYWVKGNTTLTKDTCSTWGPPNYYWWSDMMLSNTKIPDSDASILS